MFVCMFVPHLFPLQVPVAPEATFNQGLGKVKHDRRCDNLPVGQFGKVRATVYVLNVKVLPYLIHIF